LKQLAPPARFALPKYFPVRKRFGGLTPGGVFVTSPGFGGPVFVTSPGFGGPVFVTSPGFGGPVFVTV